MTPDADQSPPTTPQASYTHTHAHTPITIKINKKANDATSETLTCKQLSVLFGQKYAIYQLSLLTREGHVREIPLAATRINISEK